MFDKYSLQSQMDRILAESPELIHQAIADFAQQDEESALTVRNWVERNNAKLASIPKGELQRVD